MDCPKCNTELITIPYGDVKFERCGACHGLWFDMLKKGDLMAIKGSESIDIGDDEVGKSYNKNTKIRCPKCNIAMMPMIDKDQFHIHYEYCEKCHGTFFDAGEFRDLKGHTVIERFKQMHATLRSNID